jgi:hypothetical protein
VTRQRAPSWSSLATTPRSVLFPRNRWRISGPSSHPLCLSFSLSVLDLSCYSIIIIITEAPSRSTRPSRKRRAQNYVLMLTVNARHRWPVSVGPSKSVGVPR